ncbi:uncharacterized protein LOC129216028 [Uloborus diversus]|uniref:uncharacterized protein LOC129216028 n=1 Tax=Uloborus diversus TaxID=327109 RepID=UPI002409C69B|nr:uncharacterized protein LOC129216028 [Uloborus diversus]
MDLQALQDQLEALNQRETSTQSIAATTNCQSRGSRLLVTDRFTKQRFLIDTGSDLCAYPASLGSIRRPDPNFQLCAANDSSINTYGTLMLQLDFNLRRSFSWRFVLADVSLHIIGSDFLAYFHLLPDCHYERLIDGTTGLSTTGLPLNSEQPSVKLLQNNSSHFHEILQEFPDLIRPAGAVRQVRHSTVHYVGTTPGPPVSCRLRRLAPHQRKIAKAEFDSIVHAVPKDPGPPRCTSFPRSLTAGARVATTDC